MGCQDDPELDISEALLSSAARFLADGGDMAAAVVIASCTLEDPRWYNEVTGALEWVPSMWLKLSGPRQAHDILRDETHPITQAIWEWRQELIKIARAHANGWADSKGTQPDPMQLGLPSVEATVAR